MDRADMDQIATKKPSGEAGVLDAEALVDRLANEAREAQAVLAQASDADKARALKSAAEAVRGDAEAILAANADDLEAGRSAGLNDALLDRLHNVKLRPGKPYRIIGFSFRGPDSLPVTFDPA